MCVANIKILMNLKTYNYLFACRIVGYMKVFYMLFNIFIYIVSFFYAPCYKIIYFLQKEHFLFCQRLVRTTNAIIGVSLLFKNTCIRSVLDDVPENLIPCFNVLFKVSCNQIHLN